MGLVSPYIAYLAVNFGCSQLGSSVGAVSYLGVLYIRILYSPYRGCLWHSPTFQRFAIKSSSQLEQLAKQGEFPVSSVLINIHVILSFCTSSDILLQLHCFLMDIARG